MFDLSVCMIVKNEEEVLERCLSCVKQFADEIIVVDTGSVDNTKMLAKKWTDNVFDFEWCDDFSAARNFSFSKATKKYVMWIDADDIVDEENILKINQLKDTDEDIDIFMLKYQISFDKNDKCNFEYYRERILKRNNNYVWQGFVHECIAPNGTTKKVNIAIKHKKIEKNRDITRNLKIYEKNIAKGYVLGVRDLFYYARELFYNSKYKKAICFFKKFLKCENQYKPDLVESYIMLAKCYVQQNKQKKAKEMLIESFKTNIPNCETLCELANIFYCQKQYQNAIFWYKCSLNCEIEQNEGGFIQNDYYYFVPNLQLSCCYFYLGDKENFLKYHNKAKNEKPDNDAVKYNEQFV